MSQYEYDQTQRFRDQLIDQMNKVPDRIKNGSVQEVRSWMNLREAAGKLVKKRGATVTEYISMTGLLK